MSLPMQPIQPFIAPKSVRDIIDKSCVLNFMPMRYGNKMIDLSGRGNHGTITGATQMHPPGSAISLDGVDDRVTFADLGIFNGTHNFSLECWVKLGRLDRTQRIINLFGENELLFTTGDAAPDNTITIRVKQGGWQNTVTSPTLVVDVWYHVVVTYSATTGWKMYLNGNKEDSDATTGAINGASATNAIGADSDGSNPSFGVLDEVRIYSRALSADEVLQHYKGIFKDESNLELHYTFYTQTGNTVYDLTSNNNDGTRVGCTWTTEGRPKPTYVQPTLYFDGVNDKIVVTDKDNLDLIGSFTISTWVKTNQQSMALISKLTPSTTNGWAFRIDKGVIDVYLKGWANGAIKVNDDKWHFLSFVYYGDGTGQIYVDGVIDGSVKSGFTTPTTTSQDLWIGKETWDENEFIAKGLINEVLILNKSISADQVKRLYEWRRSDYRV